MKKEDVKQLPNFKGTAKDMGDFFYPDDPLMLTNIIIREGWMKKSDGESKVWVMMAATKMEQELNLIVLTKEKKEDYSWEQSTYIVNQKEFRDIIAKLYLF